MDFDLQRFVDAQLPMYERALLELRAGHKRSHWVWFVFPQMKGLGFSANAQFYGISSLEEARAYWAHPLLGSRLKECVDALLSLEGVSAPEVMRSPDDLKLRSSLTLFARAAPEEPCFARALDRYFGGDRCARTLSMLA